MAVVHSTNGIVSQELKYDESGKVISDTSPGFQPFGFAGGLYDSDTKLIRFGAREYDGETGRWLQKDPILFAGGDTNLYGYVLADLVNFADPYGTMATNTCVLIVGVAGGLIGIVSPSGPIGGALLGAGLGFIFCPPEPLSENEPAPR